MSSEVITRNDLLAILTEAGIPDDGMQEQINSIVNNLAVKTFDYDEFTYNGRFQPYDTGLSEGDTPRASKSGRIVNLTGAFKPNVQISAGLASMGNVPEGCKPLYEQHVLQQGSGANRYQLIITTDGEILCDRYGTTATSAIPAGAWLNLGCTYISKS